jgi:HTH-type transcriptional regulator/antitoxin HigA
LTDAESEYLSLLGDLIWTWEQGQYTLAAISPVEMIRCLLEDAGYRQKDLVPQVFPTESIASAVLNEKRKLTYDYVQRLAKFFEVSPSAFFLEHAKR